MSFSIEDLKNNVKQYVVIKEQLDVLSTRHSEIKNRLMETLEAHGETDGKGHKVLDLGEDFMGVTQIIRQRKSSKAFDMETAERLLNEKNIYEKCIVMVPTLNEDAIMAAFYDGVLTEEEIDSMFPTKVSYAFLAKK
jgi:hypothetical protein